MSRLGRPRARVITVFGHDDRDEYEVQICDVREDFGQVVRRYQKRKMAQAHAKQINEAIWWRPAASDKATDSSQLRDADWHLEPDEEKV